MSLEKRERPCILYLIFAIVRNPIKDVIIDGEDEERNTSCPHLCSHLEVVSNLSKGVTSVSLRDLTVNSHLSSDLFFGLWELTGRLFPSSRPLILIRARVREEGPWEEEGNRRRAKEPVPRWRLSPSSDSFLVVLLPFPFPSLPFLARAREKKERRKGEKLGTGNRSKERDSRWQVTGSLARRLFPSSLSSLDVGL